MYLQKCLDSCVSQTLKEIEIIIVDDCSADNSREIIIEYANKYSNISYIFQADNKKQGAARNAGIARAAGEYLFFLDSDDWIEPDTCEKLYYSADGADMAGGNYFISDNKGEKEVCLNYTGCELDEEKRLNYIKNYGMFWSRIYRRNFIISNQIFFPENVFYEDAWFNFMTALYASKIVYFKGCFYHYLQSKNSTVRNRNAPHQYDRITIADLMWDDSSERSLTTKHKTCVVYKYLAFMSSNIIYTCLGQFDNPDKEQLKRIKSSIKKRIPDYNRQTGYKYLTSEQKRYLRLVCFSARYTIFHHRYNFDRFYEYISILLKKIK